MSPSNPDAPVYRFDDIYLQSAKVLWPHETLRTARNLSMRHWHATYNMACNIQHTTCHATYNVPCNTQRAMQHTMFSRSRRRSAEPIPSQSHARLNTRSFLFPSARLTPNWGPPRPTSAPGLVSPLPHLHRDWARPSHICAGTGLAPATSAPGLGSPLPHLRRDWACPGHVCAGTGLYLPLARPPRSLGSAHESCAC